MLVALLWAIGTSSALLAVYFRLAVRLRAWHHNADPDFLELYTHLGRLNNAFGTTDITYTIEAATGKIAIRVLCVCCTRQNRITSATLDAVCVACKRRLWKRKP